MIGSAAFDMLFVHVYNQKDMQKKWGNNNDGTDSAITNQSIIFFISHCSQNN